MAYRINLNSKTHDYTPQIASILSQLRDGPRLSSDLPKSPSALIEAESLGLCRAACLERHTTSDRSVWQWSVTPAGKAWLKAHPIPKSRSRSVSTTLETDNG